MIKYLGHASIYIKTNKVSIVTDPWFSKKGFGGLAHWCTVRLKMRARTHKFGHQNHGARARGMTRDDKDP